MGILAVRQRKTTPLFALAALLAVLCLLWPRPAAAQYIENNLIDDTIFLNAASMSQAQIQTFLNGRGGYLASYNTYSDRDAATVPAARIIYEAAQDYGINPQAILATLQKEQSLVTAQNPTASQLNHAMGYGCPDGSGCVAKYVGFYKQVDNATWQLRMNFERARGNNTWWDAKYGFACGGATAYYSTGLYVGRTVTFYDDSGTAYKTFTINDAATASLYCYTPHAYPGSANQYYSGSYNFVVAFEQWFGSTQPAVTVTSPLQMTSSVSAGIYVGSPITFSFTLRNGTNTAQNIGSMMVAARDSNGTNHDFGFTSPITIDAGGSYTYTAATTIGQEGTYTFFITNFKDGQWNDNYPVSGNIINSRRVDNQFVQMMPTVTQQPAFSGELRIGKTVNASFVVQNNSASSVNLGKIGLAIRGPNGENKDAGYDMVTIPASGTYTYTKAFTPAALGTYTAYIAESMDGGWTWDETAFPAMATGQVRSITAVSKPGQTVITGLSVGSDALRLGQTSTISFQIKNFSDSAVNMGKMGIAVRDPGWVNRDPKWEDVTIAAGQTYTYSVDFVFNKVGKWNLAITNYTGSLGWNTTNPASEGTGVVRALESTVLNNPTVTTGLALSPAQPRVGQAVTITYTLTNFTNSAVVADLTGVVVRDSAWRNQDPGWVTPTVPANGTYTYSKQVTFGRTGTATIYIAGQINGVWKDASIPGETGSIVQAVNATVLPSPVVVTGLSVSPAAALGQTSTISFQIKNFSDSAVNMGKMGVTLRDSDWVNRDPKWDDVTIAAGQTYTYTVSVTFNKTGNWNVTLTNYTDALGWNTANPVSDSSGIVRSLTVAVH